jgi:cation diffusion facilitator family transporter
VNELAAHHRATELRARHSAALVAKGIGLNLALAAVKIAGGVFGNTYALIADGAESLLDVFSSAMVWAGLRMSGRPPDQEHPYGHGKAEAIAGLLVALFVFGAAAWIGKSAVHEIITPHTGPHWGTLPLLIGVIGIKFYFSRRLDAASKSTQSGAMGIEAWHHFSDAVTSAAAFIGIAIALAAGPGYEAADDWAALAACVIIAANGVSFLRKALNDVMDSAAPKGLETEVRALAVSVSGVRGIDKCRIRRSGLSHLVDIHVEVDGDLTVRDGHDIAGAVKHRLLASPLHVTDVLVHIEPARE